MWHTQPMLNAKRKQIQCHHVFAALMPLLAACSAQSGDGHESEVSAVVDGGKHGSVLDGAAGNNVDLLLATFCRSLRDCCGPAATSLLVDCEGKADGLFDFIETVRDGRAHFKQQSFKDCLAAFEASRQTCELPTTACENMVEGLVAPGGSCASPLDCAIDQGPAACVVDSGSADDGQCALLTGVAKGGDCDLTASSLGVRSIVKSSKPGEGLRYCDSGDGLFCDVTHKCTASGDLGRSCAIQDACRESFDCVDGACALSLEKGAPCSSPDDHCAEGLLCLDGRCSARSFRDSPLCVDGFK